MPESVEQQLPPDDQLTTFEQEWVTDLADVLGRGFGSVGFPKDGKRPEVRSGIYRGVISALIPIYDEIAGRDEGPMFDAGTEAAKQALWVSRVPPCQV